MTQISQVADHQIVHMDNIDSVATVFLPTFVIMIGSNTGNEHITNLILPRPVYNTWIPTYSCNVIMAGMVMADSDDGGVDLTQRGQFPLRGALLRRERVGNKCNIFATQLKTGVA